MNSNESYAHAKQPPLNIQSSYANERSTRNADTWKHKSQDLGQNSVKCQGRKSSTNQNEHQGGRRSQTPHSRASSKANITSDPRKSKSNQLKESIECAINSVDRKSNKSNTSQKSQKSQKSSGRKMKRHKFKRQSPSKISKEAVAYSSNPNQKQAMTKSKMKSLQGFFHASPYSFFNEILEQKKRVRHIEKEYQKQKQLVAEKRQRARSKISQNTKSLARMGILKPVLETHETGKSQMLSPGHVVSAHGDIQDYSSDVKSSNSIIALAQLKTEKNVLRSTSKSPSNRGSSIPSTKMPILPQKRQIEIDLKNQKKARPQSAQVNVFGSILKKSSIVYRNTNATNYMPNSLVNQGPHSNSMLSSFQYHNQTGQNDIPSNNTAARGQGLEMNSKCIVIVEEDKNDATNSIEQEMNNFEQLYHYGAQNDGDQQSKGLTHVNKGRRLKSAKDKNVLQQVNAPIKGRTRPASGRYGQNMMTRGKMHESQSFQLRSLVQTNQLSNKLSGHKRSNRAFEKSPEQRKQTLTQDVSKPSIITQSSMTTFNQLRHHNNSDKMSQISFYNRNQSQRTDKTLISDLVQIAQKNAELQMYKQMLIKKEQQRPQMRNTKSRVTKSSKTPLEPISLGGSQSKSKATLRTSNTFTDIEKKKKSLKRPIPEPTSNTMLGYVYDPWGNPPPVQKKHRRIRRIPKPPKKKEEVKIANNSASITAHLLQEEINEQKQQTGNQDDSKNPSTLNLTIAHHHNLVQNEEKQFEINDEKIQKRFGDKQFREASQSMNSRPNNIDGYFGIDPYTTHNQSQIQKIIREGSKQDEPGRPMINVSSGEFEQQRDQYIIPEDDQIQDTNIGDHSDPNTNAFGSMINNNSNKEHIQINEPHSHHQTLSRIEEQRPIDETTVQDTFQGNHTLNQAGLNLLSEPDAILQQTAQNLEQQIHQEDQDEEDYYSQDNEENEQFQSEGEKNEGQEQIEDNYYQHAEKDQDEKSKPHIEEATAPPVENESAFLAENEITPPIENVSTPQLEQIESSPIRQSLILMNERKQNRNVNQDLKMVQSSQSYFMNDGQCIEDIPVDDQEQKMKEQKQKQIDNKNEAQVETKPYEGAEEKQGMQIQIEHSTRQVDTAKKPTLLQSFEGMKGRQYNSLEGAEEAQKEYTIQQVSQINTNPKDESSYIHYRDQELKQQEIDQEPAPYKQEVQKDIQVRSQQDSSFSRMPSSQAQFTSNKLESQDDQQKIHSIRRQTVTQESEQIGELISPMVMKDGSEYGRLQDTMGPLSYSMSHDPAQLVSAFQNKTPAADILLDTAEPVRNLDSEREDRDLHVLPVQPEMSGNDEFQQAGQDVDENSEDRNEVPQKNENEFQTFEPHLEDVQNSTNKRYTNNEKSEGEYSQQSQEAKEEEIEKPPNGVPISKGHSSVVSQDNYEEDDQSEDNKDEEETKESPPLVAQNIKPDTQIKQFTSEEIKFTSLPMSSEVTSDQKPPSQILQDPNQEQPLSQDDQSSDDEQIVQNNQQQFLSQDDDQYSEDQYDEDENIDLPDQMYQPITQKDDKESAISPQDPLEIEQDTSEQSQNDYKESVDSAQGRLERMRIGQDDSNDSDYSI